MIFMNISVKFQIFLLLEIQNIRFRFCAVRRLSILWKLWAPLQSLRVEAKQHEIKLINQARFCSVFGYISCKNHSISSIFVVFRSTASPCFVYDAPWTPMCCGGFRWLQGGPSGGAI